MIQEYFPLVALAAAAAVVLLFGRKYIVGGPPKVTFNMMDAWQFTLKDWRKTPDEQLSTFGRALGHVPDSTLEDVKRDLFRVEGECEASSKPLQFLRSTIMDAAAMSLFASHILLLPQESRKELIEQYGDTFSDYEMLVTLVSYELKYTVLRCYSQFKYDDASEKDWFASYMKVARQLMAARSARARSSSASREDPALGMYLGEYLQLLEQVKEKLLSAPRSKAVDEADLLAGLPPSES